MIYRKLKAVCFCFGFFLAVSFGYAGEENLLEPLVAEALHHNPAVLAAQARFDAAKARVPQAGAWEDPRVGVKLSNVPVENPSFNRTGMTGIEYGIQQKFSTAGKKTQAKKVAQLKAEAALEELRDTRAYVVWQVSDRFYDLYDTAQSLFILHRNQNIAEALVTVAQKRFASGLAPQQDLLKAQVEYGKITDEIYAMQKKRKSLEAKLNSLIGREEHLAVRLPKYLPLLRETRSNEALLKKAKEDQFLLRARFKKAEAAKARNRLAQLKHFPDVDFGFSYRQRFLTPGDPVAGEDFFTFSATVPLPIFAHRKQTKHVIETKAAWREAVAMADETERQIEFEIRDILAEMERALKERNLFHSALLPQSRASFQNAKSAYQTGKIEFLNVLNDFLSVLHFERSLIRAEVDYAQARSKLFYLLGEIPKNIQGGNYEKNND